MDWGAFALAALGPVGGLLTILIGKWLDKRGRAGVQQSKSEAETARSFYATLLTRYDALQKRCDDQEQALNVLEAKFNRAERAREQAEDLCEAHDSHVAEIYIAGNTKWPGEWNSFVQNLRTPRPLRRIPRPKDP